MKYIAGIFFTLFLWESAAAQSADKMTAHLSASLSAGNSEHIVWVFFEDKGPQPGSFLRSPESVLSVRALNRRAKTLASVPLLDFTDFPVYREYISKIEAAGVKVKHISRWMNAVSVYANSAAINKIQKLYFVKKLDIVEKYKSSIFREENSRATFLSSPSPVQKLTDIDYGASLTQLQQIAVPALHNLGYNGSGLVIGVLDAGFNRLSHECFAQMQIIAAYDFVNHDPGVGDSTDQGSGWHGTMVLSAIGGYKPGQLVGPAYRAKFVLAKTENTFSETPIEEDNWIAGMEWMDSIGVDLTSTSLGYLDYDPPYQSLTWQQMNGNTARITIAADLAVKKGIAVFNSAGNEGYDATHNTLVAPADGDSVISVGAVASNGERASFSSVGNTVDGRIKPDIMAMGSGTVLASTTADNQYTLGSGTSFSCPIAAGAAALVLQAHPNWTPMQLRDALRNTASRHNNPDREYGWGIINALSAFSYSPAALGDLNGPVNGFVLEQNYPNPFNPVTRIQYSIPSEQPHPHSLSWEEREAGNTLVRLSVYDILGREVATLVNEEKSAGKYSVSFNASSLPSGTYFYEFRAGDFREVKKMVLLR